MSASLRALIRPYYHAAIRKPIFTVLPPLLRHLPISSKVFGPPKGTIPRTKDWVEQYNRRVGQPSAHYKRVDPGQRITRLPPKTLAPQLHPVFSELDTQSGDTFVASIPNGRVWNSNAAIITPDDLLLEDVSAEYDHERYIRGRHSVFSQVRLLRPHIEDGTVAVLTTLSVEYYSHWLLDVLPPIELLGRSDHPLESIDKFYLLEPTLSYHQETLSQLGVPASKIIDSKIVPHLQAQQLIVPSLPTGAFQPTKWVCRFLRGQFPPSRHDEARDAPRRIYISRAKTGRRRVLNEDQVLDFLRPLGFCIVFTETLSIAEKSALFSTAEVVVFPAGSGYVNILFCEPGTSVVELFNPSFIDTPTWLLSNELGLDYYYALGEEYNTKDLPIATDIIVNIDILSETLKLAGINYN